MTYAWLILPTLLQVALIVHCFKTGRDTIWIWVLLFLPGAGGIAYLLVEVLPGLVRSRGTQRAVRGVRRALDPQQQLRRFEAEAQQKGDVASRQRLADELVRQGRPAEAIALYQQCLTGLYASDPGLLQGLANAQYAAGQPSEALASLERLAAENLAARTPDAHLLYAKVLAACGQRERALSEYAQLARSYAGAEAPLRYAELLNANGQRDQARQVLRELMDHARLAPQHYRRMQQSWLSEAERLLATLG